MNNITDKNKFNRNVRANLNELASQLFPDNMMWSFPAERFQPNFDSIENTFNGLARDYLLSRLMVRAASKGTIIPPDYEARYKQYAVNKTYHKIYENAKKQRLKEVSDKTILPNTLLAADRKTETTIEKVLEQNTGKVIIIDLWASWCGPCIDELPYLDSLRQKIPEDKLTIIGLSLDKNESEWAKAMLKYKILPGNNYLLKNATKTAFYKQYKIAEIPRYIMINSNGKLISDNAPAPSDGKMEGMLNAILKL